MHIFHAFNNRFYGMNLRSSSYPSYSLNFIHGGFSYRTTLDNPSTTGEYLVNFHPFIKYFSSCIRITKTRNLLKYLKEQNLLERSKKVLLTHTYQYPQYLSPIPVRYTYSISIIVIVSRVIIKHTHASWAHIIVFRSCPVLVAPSSCTVATTIFIVWYLLSISVPCGGRLCHPLGVLGCAQKRAALVVEMK